MGAVVLSWNRDQTSYETGAHKGPSWRGPTTNPLIAKLEAVSALSDDARQAIEAICCNTRPVEKGEDIVRQGDKSDQVYLLLEGWASRYKVLPDGSRQITAFLLPGDFCGTEIVVFKRMEYSVTALTPVTISSVDHSALIQLTRERAELAQAFWWATLVEQAVLDSWIVNLGRRDSYGRVAHQACELHARMKARGLANGREFNVPLTQEQLGDALGLTSVHVNRVLKRLREEGLMELRDRTLTLLNPERLGALAAFDASYLHPTTA